MHILVIRKCFRKLSFCDVSKDKDRYWMQFINDLFEINHTSVVVERIEPKAKLFGNACFIEFMVGLPTESSHFLE
jgi:hypothetical protein